MFRLIEKLRAGDHVALFYRSRAEQFSAVVPYIAIGLERKERCLYIADDNSVAMVLQQLEKAGVDVRGAERSGALRVTTKRETYLRDGIFEPEKMIAALRAEVTTSLRQGYRAFRATGEMTWALTLPSTLSRLTEYEAELHAQFPAEFIGLCQYNETSFPEQIITDMIEIHPKVIARGQLLENRFYRAGGMPGRLGPHLITVDELVSAGTETPSLDADV